MEFSALPCTIVLKPKEIPNLNRPWQIYGDFLGRVGIVCYFTYAATNLGIVAFDNVRRLRADEAETSWLGLVANLVTVFFMVLVVATTVIRLKPLDTAQGFLPRFVALAGTYASVLITGFKPTVVSPMLQIPGFILAILGMGLAVYVISWLGRSFSIMAEARRLVTAGPYSTVRHPLYVAEGIALVGIVLLHFSLPAVLIAIVQWGLQLQRMKYEEGVLLQSFPDYATYMKTTPRVIPALFRRNPIKITTAQNPDAF